MLKPDTYHVQLSTYDYHITVMWYLISYYALPLCLLCTPVMTSYVPAHSRNLIIMFNKLKKGQPTLGMGGSDECRYDALLIVVEILS